MVNFKELLPIISLIDPDLALHLCEKQNTLGGGLTPNGKKGSYNRSELLETLADTVNIKKFNVLKKIIQNNYKIIQNQAKMKWIETKMIFQKIADKMAEEDVKFLKTKPKPEKTALLQNTINAYKKIKKELITKKNNLAGGADDDEEIVEIDTKKIKMKQFLSHFYYVLFSMIGLSLFFPKIVDSWEFFRSPEFKPDQNPKVWDESIESGHLIVYLGSLGAFGVAAFNFIKMIILSSKFIGDKLSFLIPKGKIPNDKLLENKEINNINNNNNNVEIIIHISEPNDRLVEELNDLKNEIAEKTRENSQLVEQFEDLREEIARTQKQQQESETESEMAAQQLEIQTQTSENLRALLDQSEQKKSQMETQARLQGLKVKNLEAEKEKIKSTLKQVGEGQSRTEQEAEKLMEVAQSMRKELETKTEKAEMAAQQLAIQTQTSEHLRSLLDQSEQKISQMEAEALEKGRIVETLEAKLSGVETSSKELAKEFEEVVNHTEQEAEKLMKVAIGLVETQEILKSALDQKEHTIMMLKRGSEESFHEGLQLSRMFMNMVSAQAEAHAREGQEEGRYGEGSYDESFEALKNSIGEMTAFFKRDISVVQPDKEAIATAQDHFLSSEAANVLHFVQPSP